MSYILDALRRSESQRREIEDEPLVRLTAVPPPKKSHWRFFVLVFSALSNIVVLAYLFGPAELPFRYFSQQTAAPSARVDKAEAATIRPDVEKHAVAEKPPPRTHLPDAEKKEAAHGPSAAKTEATSTATRSAEVRSGLPAAAPNRPVKEIVHQRQAIAQSVTSPRSSAAVPGDSSEPTMRGQAKLLVPDRDRSPAMDRSESEADGLPKPKINVYAYTARVEGDRFVIIRNQKYREGDRIEDGPVVRRIEEHAMTLEFAGRTYQIPRP